MASVKQFEDLESWKEARLLAVIIYKKLERCRDLGYKDQIQRASVSIMNNIAEGFERGSDKEFRQFLYIAKGSAGEVRSMVILGVDLGYFTRDEAESLFKRVRKISGLLAGFIKTL